MTEETLFHEALARPLAERAAFLARACAGQPELRAGVEGLLAAHESPGSILDRPAAADPVGIGEYTPEPEDAAPKGPSQRTTIDYQPATGPGAVIAGR
jgi:eukaryotic-like serine/threonine-protein kinase